MTVEGMTIINTETRASVLLCDKSTRAIPRARAFVDDVPFKHIMGHFSITALALGLAGYAAQSIGRVSGGKGNVASALVQRPSSEIDKANTGRNRSHKSRTDAFWSVVRLVVVNALDKGPSSSDLA